MKSYQDNVVSYREQCQTLKEEKAALLKTKQDLENEVTQLKDELEGLSFSSTFSQQTRHSQSCSSLYSLERTERDTEVSIVYNCSGENVFMRYINHTLFLH